MKQFWVKDEMDKLAEMAAQGKTNAQIAAALCRSVGSVAHKRARLFRDAEQADKLSAITYCDDPHRLEAITVEDDLMKEVSDVIDRLNTLSDALAGTSEFMEQLREGQKIITEDQIEQCRQFKAIKDSIAELKERINHVLDKAINTATGLRVIEDAHDKTARKLEEALRDVHDLSTYMAQGRLWRLFHSFRSFREGRGK